MKKLIITAIASLTTLWSCDLNYVPLEQMSAEEAFKDSLRLEMCYPLNGSDLSPDNTPLELSLIHI